MNKRYALRFEPALVGQPMVSKLVRSFDVDVNILNADVSSGRGGKLIVELVGDEPAILSSVNWLIGTGVVVSEIVKELVFDQAKCIGCGACTAVCASGALSFDEQWKLCYDASKCVVCALCVNACPLRLFQLSTEREI